MHKMRVKSDNYNKYKKEYGDFGDCIPVDLYGKRITVEKDNPDNLKNIGEDIKEFYGLEGDLGLS